MTERKFRYTLGILGLLDLVSFFRTYTIWVYSWGNLSYISNSNVTLWEKVLGIGVPVLNLILSLLLLASGLLLALGKKAGITVYYFEFPLRLLFSTLTLGFILRLSELQIDSLAYKVVLVVLFTFELLRLVFSIWAQKKIFIKSY